MYDHSKIAVMVAIIRDLDMLRMMDVMEARTGIEVDLTGTSLQGRLESLLSVRNEA